MKSLITLYRMRDMRNAMLRLKEADPQAWEAFLTQFLRDMHMIPPVFFSDTTKAEVAEAKRRVAMSYLKLLAEDDPQSIITRLEAEQKVTQNV
jgi:hypothetical protein